MLLGGHRVFAQPLFDQNGDIDPFIEERLARDHIPGLAACVTRETKVVWSKGYGYADIARKTPMSPTDSLQNIGSVSKTMVATAVMQLWEQKKLDLEKDVNTYLPFPVRNPNHPDLPITPRQLLTHRSSIKDGLAYGQSYACGDPAEKLGDWLRNYLTPGGDYYDAADNFHPWQPGTEASFPFPPPNYSNVGFGLLAFLVETITGQPFYTYCQEQLFDPLEMENSGWFIRDIERKKHVVPYDFLPPDFQLPPGMTYERLLPQESETERAITPESYFPHCLYSFPNYPDGLLRTSPQSNTFELVFELLRREW